MTQPRPSPREAARHLLPSGLIHDLRTPLNLIIDYSEMLIEQAEGQGRSDFVPELRKTRDAGLQLLTLIDGSFEPVRTRAASEDTSALACIDAAAAKVGPPDPKGGLAPGLTHRGTSPGTRPARGSLLVVDDLEASRVLLARLLEHQGYTVATAEGGAQALDMLRTAPFALVLLDVTMPGMDGYEVLRRMKAEEALRRIPVLMVSASNELESVVRCIELGAVDYLGRPFNSTLLKARIGACLEKERADEAERDLKAMRGFLETSHHAGMAEVATSVLRHVGDLLRSVNVSSGLILDKIERSKVMRLEKTADLLEGHAGDPEGGADHDPETRELLGYLALLEMTSARERWELLREVHTLLNKVLHIQEIVAMQQHYAHAFEATASLGVQGLGEAVRRPRDGGGTPPDQTGPENSEMQAMTPSPVPGALDRGSRVPFQ